MHSVCVSAELHVTVNCIKTVSVAQQCFMVNLCHRQQCNLNLTVVAINFLLLFLWHAVLTV
jgi:hypothetical protein